MPGHVLCEPTEDPAYRDIARLYLILLVVTRQGNSDENKLVNKERFDERVTKSTASENLVLKKVLWRTML